MPPSQTADLTLFYAPRSRAVMALWLLEELGQPYRLEHVDLARGDHKKPEFLQHNRMGKVPLVLDRGLAISETGAIVAYLADRYALGRLAPRLDDPERAAYLRWLFFGAGVIEPAASEKFFNLQVPRSQVGWGSFDDMLATVSKAVSGREWLAGDQFTAADLYVGSQLNFGLQFRLVEQEGPVADYVARCTDRPSYERSMALEARFVAEQEAGKG
jgi:glutathione S-transferase